MGRIGGGAGVHGQATDTRQLAGQGTWTWNPKGPEGGLALAAEGGAGKDLGGLRTPGTPDPHSQLQEDKVLLASHKHIHQLQDIWMLHPGGREKSQALELGKASQRGFGGHCGPQQAHWPEAGTA